MLNLLFVLASDSLGMKDASASAVIFVTEYVL